MLRLKYMVIMAAIAMTSCNSDKEKSIKSEPLKDDLKVLLKEPKNYVCYFTDEEIQIDGNIEKEIWQKAEWTDIFVDIEGDAKPKPLQETKVKMLWDSNYLYIAAKIDEEHIWAYLENHDDIVFRDNDFEVFIDPDNDAKNYFEFEINAKGTVFDLFLPHPYRHSSFALHNWDFKGIKKAIKINGTLNNGDDKDLYWTVELAIPFYSLSFGLDSGKPNLEKPWRINFSRVQWQTKWENGKYVKLQDENGNNLPEYNWVWSPVGAISMHMPERYGYLKFSENKVGTNKDEFKLTELDKLKNVLWAVFYRQDAYYQKNTKYISSVSELGNDIYSLFDQKEFNLSLVAADTLYEAKLESSKNKIKLYISNEGTITDMSHTIK